MPRIDPNQLLKCLSVLLHNKGGIKSTDEVSRLASLMTKFSKKLVSKCIYIMILRASDTSLLDAFMNAGGWDLTFNWLSDAIGLKNWALVEELVELLVACPVDIERLKGNNCPKLIKILSKDPSASERVREVACSVVDLWLTIVKGACANNNEANKDKVSDEEVSSSTPHIVENTDLVDTDESTIPKGVYKITIRDGKKVLAEVIGSDKAEAEDRNEDSDEISTNDEKAVTERSILKVVNEDPVAQESLPPKKLAEGKRQQLSLKRKNDKKLSPEPEKHISKEKKKSSIEKKLKLDMKSRLKEKKSSERSLKDRHKDTRTSEEKAQEEKDKLNLLKLITPSIGNLGKIPKKSKDDPKKDDKKTSVLKSPTDPKKVLPKDPKKYNISIETRKSGEDRPKTVKTFNSRFRSTGLEEVPPPPKNIKKKEEIIPERKSVKRSSPVKEVHIPEKKPKEEEKPPEKPIITSPSSKPKSLENNSIRRRKRTPSISGLQESDVFADALTAANPVKDVKKRKRRPSNSNSSSPSAETKKENNSTSKSEEKEAVKPVFKFYQETLITSEEKTESKDEVKEDIKNEPESTSSDAFIDEIVTETLSKEELEDEVARSEKAIDQVMKMEEKRNVEREKNRIPEGILTYTKKCNAIKKHVTFRDRNLVEVRHFELDENERVNVTKTFMDMRQSEKFNERILFQRKLVTEDVMEEKTPWRPLIPVDIPSTGEAVIPGQNSIEKEIQHARERTTLQAIYFNRSLIPDSPQEPDLEIHAMTEPASIPLKDTTGNPDSVISYKDKPWPEAKGFPPGVVSSPPRGLSPPHMPMIPVPPQMMPMPGPGGMFPPQQFPPQGPPMQPFIPPGMIPSPDWMGNPDGNMMMGGPPGNEQMMMGGMNPAGIPPGLLPPPEMYNMGGPPPHPDFMGPPFPITGPPPPHGMFPPNGPSGYNQDNGPMSQGPPNQRHQRPWFRGQDNSRGGGGTWRHPSKGGGGWSQQNNKMCKYYLKKGICRQSNCTYRHGSAKGGIR